MIWISHLLEDEKMKQIVEETGVGIESIEFSVAENLDHLEKTLQLYRNRLKNMKCTELTLHGPFLDLNPAAFDRLVQEATMHRYEQAYLAAKELGAGKVIFHSCFVPSVYFLEGWADRVADFYDRFLDGKSDEIQILMENVLDPYPEPLTEVARKVQHPAFGLCLDIGHANCYSKVPCERWAEQMKPYLRHLHIHDNQGQKDTHSALGDGCIDWENLKRIIGGIDRTIECTTWEDVRKTCGYLMEEQERES